MKSLTIVILSAAVLFGSVALSTAADRIFAASPRIGKEFRNFTLSDVDGNDVSLSDFRGKTIILSFMSCYTDTCLSSVGIIKGLIEQLGDQGLVAPMVCSEIPESLKKIKYAELQKQCGTGQVILIDEDPKLATRYGIDTFPRTYLIGKDFKIRDSIHGIPPLRRADFAERVKALVEE
jgi:peroxiredoxin